MVANGCASFCGSAGGKPGCLAWITTPFILERANPSKDGDAKLWAFSHPSNTAASGRQAAEGMGRWRARPSPDFHHIYGWWRVRDPGTKSIWLCLGL